jgi:hypothetical protein
MKPRKLKATKPSLRDLLSQNFLKAFERDFAAAIKALREKSPEKYAEIAARLIAATEPKPEGFKAARNREEIAVALLKSVGIEEDKITPDMVEAAVAANGVFVARLEAIRDVAQAMD